MVKSFYALFAFLLFVSSALALDFTQPMLSLDGKPIHETGDVKSPIITLSYIAVTALMKPKVDPTGRPLQLSGPEQLKRFNLAQKINDAKDVMLDAAEIKTIEEAVADAGFGPLYYGRIYEAIDPTGKEKAKTPEKK